MLIHRIFHKPRIKNPSTRAAAGLAPGVASSWSLSRTALRCRPDWERPLKRPWSHGPWKLASSFQDQRRLSYWTSLEADGFDQAIPTVTIRNRGQRSAPPSASSSSGPAPPNAVRRFLTDRTSRRRRLSDRPGGRADGFVMSASIQAAAAVGRRRRKCRTSAR